MFRLFRRAPNLDATAINRAQPRYFPNLGATPVLIRSWLGQDAIYSWRTRSPVFGGPFPREAGSHFGGRQLPRRGLSRL